MSNAPPSSASAPSSASSSELRAALARAASGTARLAARSRCAGRPASGRHWRPPRCPRVAASLAGVDALHGKGPIGRIDRGLDRIHQLFDQPDVVPEEQIDRRQSLRTESACGARRYRGRACGVRTLRGSTLTTERANAFARRLSALASWLKIAAGSSITMAPVASYSSRDAHRAGWSRAPCCHGQVLELDGRMDRHRIPGRLARLVRQRQDIDGDGTEIAVSTASTPVAS